jgi:SAM-dependent methyltransferase
MPTLPEQASDPALQTCRICGERAGRTVARPDPWTYLACRACGVYWVEPMPSGAAIEDADSAYTEAYYSGDARPDEDAYEDLTRKVMTARIERIEAELGRKGRLLDVGCATGAQLHAARDRGWETVGVEVSATAAEAARARGLEVITSTLDQAGLADGSFDAIVLSHVLEHVPDPVGLLRECRRLLRPDGVIALALPNSDGFLHTATNLFHRLRRRLGRDRYSCSLFPPYHLYAFDPASLVRALAEADLYPAAIRITGKGDPETYPMRSWSGVGRMALAQRLVERVGRAIGRGSLLEVLARP